MSELKCPHCGTTVIMHTSPTAEGVHYESEAERVLRELYAAELQLCEYDLDDSIDADDPRYLKALADYKESRRQFTDFARRLAGETTTKGE